MAVRHTTLRLSDALMRHAKAYARRHDMTLTAVMERALSAYLAERQGKQAALALELPSFGRRGPRKGVKLDDTSSLLDIMDGIE